MFKIKIADFFEDAVDTENETEEEKEDRLYFRYIKILDIVAGALSCILIVTFIVFNALHLL